MVMFRVITPILIIQCLAVAGGLYLDRSLYIMKKSSLIQQERNDDDDDVKRVEMKWTAPCPSVIHLFSTT